jgi:hypothetical protein
MLKKEEFVEMLELSLENAFTKAMIKDKNRPNILIHNAEEVEFNLEEVLSLFAKEKEVNLAIVDISSLTEKDVETIPQTLSMPTIMMIKNFGDFEYDTDKEYLRNHYRSLVKDCHYDDGAGCIFANNFLFAVATTTRSKTIRDVSEITCFRHLNTPKSN